jgi:hypothetical protein
MTSECWQVGSEGVLEMVRKWSDYVISGIRYNDEDDDYIAMVKVRENKAGILENAEEWDRRKVVSEIERGKTFDTIMRDENGNWHIGQEVHIISIHGDKYIRTDQNSVGSDNLESLPEF